MKMNHDCMRDILLHLENLNFDDLVETNSIVIKNYSHEEIVYHVEKLLEAQYLNAYNVSTMSGRGYIIKSITYHGHLFLDNVRPDDVWIKVKNISKSIGTVSLEILSNTAARIIISEINKLI